MLLDDQTDGTSACVTTEYLHFSYITNLKNTLCTAPNIFNDYQHHFTTFYVRFPTERNRGKSPVHESPYLVRQCSNIMEPK